MSHWDEWFDARFLMIVAHNAERTVVINTGPPPDLTAPNNLWRGFHPSGRVQYSRDDQERPVQALASIGIDPGEVTHVLVTPIVAYTVGNLTEFSQAQYAFSRRGWIEDVFAPPFGVHVPREILLPDDVMSYLLFDARERVRLVNSDEEIVPGIRVWDSLVHHRSSLAVCIETSSGKVVATDSVFSYGNLDHYLGIGESYAEAMATNDRLKREADVLIPLYEPEVLRRYTGGKIA
jgi:hypothetical protein